MSTAIFCISAYSDSLQRLYLSSLTDYVGINGSTFTLLLLSKTSVVAVKMTVFDIYSVSGRAAG